MCPESPAVPVPKTGGALHGADRRGSVGFGVDPWLLALISSVPFALGHAAQGDVGIIVTDLLRFVLARRLGGLFS